MPIPIIAVHGGLFRPVQGSPETQRYARQGLPSDQLELVTCVIHGRSHPLALSSQTVFIGVFYLIDDRLYSAILRSLEQTHCARM